MREPLITICIPAYNAERTLLRSVDSVLAQNYEACELVIVDDGSVDGTADMCRDLAARYTNISFVRQKNKGQIEARRKAVSKAKGQWVLFLDSDDELESGSLRLLSIAIMETGADIVFFDYVVVDFAGHAIPKPELFPEAHGLITSVSRDDVLVKFLATRKLNSMCYHIVKTHLVDMAFDDESVTHLRYGEDVVQNISLYSRAETFAYVKVPLYLYVENESSVTHKVDREKQWADMQEVRKAVHSFASRVNLNEERRKEAERGMRVTDAMIAIEIASKAHFLPRERVKSFLREIRSSFLLKGIDGRAVTKLPISYQGILFLLGVRFDALLVLVTSIRDRNRLRS